MDFVNLLNTEKKSAIQIIKNNYSIIGPERHQLAKNIISIFSLSNDPLDNLAVAMAYEWEGAKYRNLSIKHYEKYIKSNVKTTLFSEWLIYSSLAVLYEKEYEFEKALHCLNKLIIFSNGENCSDYIRIGDIYTKQDINKALSYYQYLMTQPCYEKHKNAFDFAYKAVKEKQARGYIYKPRKRKLK